MSAEPKKPTAPDAKEATAPKSDQAVKHHKRTARHYAARRLYAPYPVGWYNGSAGANRGWVAASSARRRTHRTGNSWDGKTGAAGFPKVPAG